MIYLENAFLTFCVQFLLMHFGLSCRAMPCHRLHKHGCFCYIFASVFFTFLFWCRFKKYLPLKFEACLLFLGKRKVLILRWRLCAHAGLSSFLDRIGFVQSKEKGLLLMHESPLCVKGRQLVRHRLLIYKRRRKKSVISSRMRRSLGTCCYTLKRC